MSDSAAQYTIRNSELFSLLVSTSLQGLATITIVLTQLHEERKKKRGNDCTLGSSLAARESRKL